jgi:dihydrofolate reductase
MVNYEGKQLMKLVVTEYISLDGVVENPIWIAPYFDADFLKFKFDELMGGDALLMGRHTYDYFIPTWATDQPVEDAPGQEGFAERLDQLPKHVVSSTLKNPVWNNTRIIHENIVEAVSKLKQQPGGQRHARTNPDAASACG